jgi:heat shock protein HslJ
MRMSARAIVGLTLALGLCLTSVTAAAVTDEPASGPEDVRWALLSLADEAPPDGVESTLTLEDGMANGFADCNRFFGDYVLEGESLSIGPLGTTLMACEDPVMRFEADHLTALGQVASFRIEDGVLVLSDAGGTELLRYIVAPAADVTGDWIVTGINNGRMAVVSPLEGTRPTSRFGEDGEISGDAGCNRFFGPYVVDGASMSIGPLGSTLMACADVGVDEQERQYLAALESVDTWELDATGQTLRDADRRCSSRSAPSSRWTGDPCGSRPCALADCGPCR